MLFSTIWIPRLIFPGIHYCGAFPVGYASCNLHEELKTDRENRLQEPVSRQPSGAWSGGSLQEHGRLATFLENRLQEPVSRGRPGSRAGSVAAHTVLCAPKDSGVCSHLHSLES